MITMVDKYNITKYTGLATDGFPVNTKNGDEFYAMDEATKYIYDIDNDQWHAQPASGGGGGGDGVVLVTLAATWNSGDSICEFEADMDADEIAAELEDGKTVKCVISCDPDDANIGELDGVELPVASFVTSPGGDILVFVGIVGELTPASLTKVTGTAAIAYFKESNNVIQTPTLTLTMS